MPKIIPSLWFDGQAEEAIAFYAAIFARSGLKEAHPNADGSLLCATFELEGQEFFAINGGPHFTFNEAVSFLIRCDSQEEVDFYWDRLLRDGGTPSQCGWLKDRFGLSWQVVPNLLTRLTSDPDRQRAGRVVEAMLKMSKLDCAALQAAFDQEPG